jgi:selenocysteine-specific elongation factor
MISRVIATAGHVDHGKSTLVETLTGTHPDRFAEEQRRGMTIDLGFAHTLLPSGNEVSFVDVPGHVRFVGNMLAGVSDVTAALFVVAATEAWKPQSEEHLRILELLGLRHGIIALTKADLVDPDHLELAELDVIDHVAGTFLEGAPIVAVSAPTGRGLDELRQQLDALLVRAPAPADTQRPRLWVDRIFVPRGAGTVVTGTLAGGSIAVDDHLVVGPQRLAARVRRLQHHGHDVTTLAPGHRVAANLVGVEHDLVHRGHGVHRDDQWRSTRLIDVELNVVASLDHPVSRRGAYVAHIGSGDQSVRLRILGPDTLAPGSHGFARMHLAEPLPLTMGDRFILRESGRGETVGGGTVIDVQPIKRASKAQPDSNVDRIIAEHELIDVHQLWLLTGEQRPPTLGQWVIDPALVTKRHHQLSATVTAAGEAGIDIAALDEISRLIATTDPAMAVLEGRVRPVAARDAVAEHPFLATLAAAGVQPPAPDGIDRDTIRQWVRRALVIQRDDVLFHPVALDLAATAVRQLLFDNPAGFTVAQFRDALAITRKYALPLITELDARGITRRRDDLRIAGPRLNGA